MKIGSATYFLRNKIRIFPVINVFYRLATPRFSFFPRKKKENHLFHCHPNLEGSALVCEPKIRVSKASAVFSYIIGKFVGYTFKYTGTNSVECNRLVGLRSEYSLEFG